MAKQGSNPTSDKEKEIIESVIGPIPGNVSLLVSVKDLRGIIQAAIRSTNKLTNNN